MTCTLRADFRAFLSSRPRLAARCAVITPALVAVLLYIRALANGFAYDDIPVIPTNDWVRHGAVLTRALSLPYWPSGMLYRPLTSFSYGIDWALSAGNPAFFHAVNLVWYGIGTALVAALALRFWSPLAAACAGFFFAFNPVHVEAVANVVGRAELVCIAALVCVALAASSRGPVTDARVLIITGLSALALAAKETGAVAPIIAWASARLRASESPPPSDNIRRATLAASMGVAILLTARYAVLDTLAGDFPHPAFLAATSLQSVALALATLPRALLLVTVPQLPGLDYSPTLATIRHPNGIAVASGVALIIVGLGVFVQHRRRPSPWTWATVFSIATFAPVSNLVLHTGVVLADRTLYGPSAGVALMFGGAIAAAITQWPRAQTLAIAIPAAAVWFLAGARFTEQSVPIWRDNHTVFTAMCARSPASYRGYYLLGKTERAHGPSREAQQHYVTALALFDRDPNLLYDAGINALGLADTTHALSWLNAALAQDSSERRARTSLALLEIRRGDTADARAVLRAGLEREPDQRLWRAALDSLNHGSRASATPPWPAHARPPRAPAAIPTAAPSSAAGPA